LNNTNEIQMTKSETRKGQVLVSRHSALVMVVLASLLLLGSLKLPLWQMRLEAPQYRDEEALKIAIYPNAMRGDIRELKVLNQYIGVHVPPTLPQFNWLPRVIAGAAALGLVAASLRNRARARILLTSSSGLAVALLVATIQAQFQMHDIGHKRDPKTILAGMRDFTPPFLGTTKIAQFTVSSGFGAGVWLIGGALTLQLGAAWVSRSNPERPSQCTRNTQASLSPYVGSYTKILP
jgi:copper chaperone NosL